MASIEIEAFQLASGVTREGFIAMDAIYQEYCYLNQSGLMRRTTASSDDNWLVVTWWHSPPAELESSSATTAWRAAIDESTYRRKVYETLG